MNRSLLIAENNPSGHRLVYVRLVLQYALRNGLAVSLAIPPTVRASKEFAEHIGSLSERVALISVPEAASLKYLVRLARENRLGHVLVLDGDKYLTEASTSLRSSSIDSTLLIMRDPAWESSGSPMRRLRAFGKHSAIALVRKRRTPRLVLLREPSTQTSAIRDSAMDPLILDGERTQILEDAYAFRRTHGLDSTTFWFGIVGALTERKNVPLVASALQRVALETERPLGFALLGPSGHASSWDRTELLRHSALAGLNVANEDALLSNYEVNVRVAALDCVVVAYSTNAPNSTMAKAAGLGVRLVVAGSAQLRHFAHVTAGVEGVPLELTQLTRALGAQLLRAPPPACELAGPDDFAQAVLAGVLD